MIKSNESELNIIAIKTKDKVYISDNLSGSGYHTSYLNKYFFDGEKPKNTYDKAWFQIDKIPEKVEKTIPSEQINIRFELKPQFTPSELTPKIINETYIDDENEFYEVRGLYERKYDLTEETKESINFKINIIEELDEFEITKKEFDLKFNLLDRLNTHPILLPTKPCKLSAENSYKIIRNYIKENISPKYARIKSDYDSHLAIVKIIELDEIVPYQVDVNFSLFGRKRKPKYETRYQKAREVEIYKIAPKSYNDYDVVTPFSGKNQEDLKQNIENSLIELIEKINKPLVDCPHCHGYGVILDDIKGE